jgi:hypothetical protein
MDTLLLGEPLMSIIKRDIVRQKRITPTSILKQCGASSGYTLEDGSFTALAEACVRGPFFVRDTQDGRLDHEKLHEVESS